MDLSGRRRLREPILFGYREKKTMRKFNCCCSYANNNLLVTTRFPSDLLNKEKSEVEKRMIPTEITNQIRG